MDRPAIETAVRASFNGELAAFKPGNVSVHANGHGMTAQDFLTSAAVSAPLLCNPKLGVGQRILESVKATKAAVGCNTNLGMLLLFSPLIVAAESAFNNVDAFRSRLERVLNSLTQQDTEAVYEAIRIANPGGLGTVATQDVRQKTPTCSFIETMQLASNRDSIAAQYSTNYRDIFGAGLANIKYFVSRWNSVEWATVSCFMMYLSSMRDSHIERKYGKDIAKQVKINSVVVAKRFNTLSDPKSGLTLLKEFDATLKAKNYNPGTSADLTATTLLVYNLNLNYN